ncbi:MAG TPA: ferric reductase-like transmembrane domain-containing protein, partial [Solirubrobacteraceae bacterium]|nr:ferric reductase-like transmembrane domain-containing protein [Solirubrobacteraceae bacterium]
MTAPRGRGLPTGWDLSVLALANAAIVAGLWWRQGGLRDIHDLGGLLTSAGRLTGLLGAYLALVQVLLLGRIPALDRALGFARVAAWHRRNGVACLGLLAAHAVLVTAGYAAADGAGVGWQAGELLSSYPGVLLALIGLGLLVAVVVTSVAIVRRRLGHRAWHAVHLTAYAAIALAFSH